MPNAGNGNVNSAIGDSIACLGNIEQTLPVKKIFVHPLVLLSVVDHFRRINRQYQDETRVMGVLLGSVRADKSVEIFNSFAVTLKEESKNDMNCFVDVDYLEAMHKMFYKVSSKEKVVGWYHTGPTLFKMKKFTLNPVLVIIPPNAVDISFPTDAYVEVQEEYGSPARPIKTFEHVPSEIAAEVAEDVGVEHLLRGIKGLTPGTLSQRIFNQLMGLRSLHSQLADIQRYLRQVSRSEMPLNQTVIYLVQETLNLLPDVLTPNFVRVQNMQLNNQIMCAYIGTLVRSIVSHHDLILSKIPKKEA